MKSSTLLWRWIVQHSFAMLLTCLPGLLMAAEKTPPANVPDTRPLRYDLQIIDGQLIRPQGKVEATLANVVDALRDQYAEANIILSPGLSKLTVGDLKLRAGKLSDELEAVRVASGEKFDVQAPATSIPQQIDPNTGFPVGGAAPNAGLFVLREAAPTAQTQRVVEAFNVGPYLEWQRHQPKDAGQTGHDDDASLVELESIITDTLIGFQGETFNQNKPSFQYHRGATLLIVIGKVDSVEIARKIVNALPGMSSAPSVAADRNAREHAAEDAFRARYGLMRRPAPATQPEPVPETGPAK